MMLASSLAAEILHLVLIAAAAPTVAGLSDWVEARIAGRAGPSPLLPGRDLLRLSRKTPSLSETVSVVSRIGPAVTLGSTAAAAALVPSFTLGMALSPLADVVVLASLLTVARVAAALAALDSGAALPGLIQQAASAHAVLAEPALLLVMLALGLMAGSFNLDLIIGQQREGILLPAAASAIVLLALLALLLAETTAGDRDTLSVFSGMDLAMMTAAGWLRRLVWFDLIGGLFLPFGIATADPGALAWLTGLAFWALRIGVFILALTAAQTVIGRLPRHALPDLVGVAALLALLAVLMILVSAGSA